MKTTVDFLDALKAKNGGCSDYRLAQILAVSRAQVSKYRNRRDFLGNEMAFRVADLLQIDRGFVLACAHLERSKSEPEKQVWQGIAALFPDSIRQTLCIM
jgi:plasmid maintenance system antidote protein VapI